MLRKADLPGGGDALPAHVIDQVHQLDLLKVFQAKNKRLKAATNTFISHRFGFTFEHLDADEFELALEEI